LGVTAFGAGGTGVTRPAIGGLPPMRLPFALPGCRARGSRPPPIRIPPPTPPRPRIWPSAESMIPTTLKATAMTAASCNLRNIRKPFQRELNNRCPLKRKAADYVTPDRSDWPEFFCPLIFGAQQWMRPAPDSPPRRNFTPAFRPRKRNPKRAAHKVSPSCGECSKRKEPWRR